MAGRSSNPSQQPKRPAARAAAAAVASEESEPTRFERIVTYMTGGLVALGLVCIIATLVGTAIGLTSDDFSSGIWQVIFIVPLFAFGLGMVGIMVVLFTAMRRKARDAKRAR